MKKQKVLSLVLAAALCVSTPASAMAADFTSGPEDTTVQVTTEETTEAVTEDAFTDSTDGEGDAEVTDEAADATEFAPEAEDGEDDATLNAEAGSDIDSASEISFKTRYTGALSVNNAVDFYKITLNSAGCLSINGTVKGDFGLKWTVYNELGVKMTTFGSYYTDSSTGIGTFEPWIRLTKGEYYLSASKYHSDRSGSYVFNLGFKSANETISEDQGGSNNTMDDADEISLNKTYKGQIAYNDGVDYYKFSVPKDENVKMIWKSQDSSDLDLYDSIGSKISSSWGSLYEKEWFLEKGDYYLKISDGSNYQFTLQTHTHKWKNEVTKATLTENGTIIPKCDCGVTGTAKTIYCPKTIRLSKTRYKYNGYAQKPTVKVIGSDGKVISPSYYKVTYSRGLTAKGKYTVKITFKGRYSGSVKKYFKIV